MIPSGQSLTKATMRVRIGRAICVFLLAVAIAMLPLSAGFATTTTPGTVSRSVVKVMPDCDHHQHHHGAPSGETHKPFDHSNCIAACALCFGFVDARVSEIAYALPASSEVRPAPVSTDLSSLMGSPPFRPPRA
jgi:hypothetical protein